MSFVRMIMFIVSIGVVFASYSSIASSSTDELPVSGEFTMNEVSVFNWGHEKPALIKRVDNNEAVCYVYVGIGISCLKKEKCPGDVGDKLPEPGPGNDPCGLTDCN